MGRIVGGVGLSHVPSIGPVVDRNRTQEPAWKPLFDAYIPVREWLARYREEHEQDDPEAVHVQILRRGTLGWLTGGRLVPREEFLGSR
jgi:hypothetical protein